MLAPYVTNTRLVSPEVLVTGHQHEAVQGCKYFTGDKFYLINRVLSWCSPPVNLHFFYSLFVLASEKLTSEHKASQPFPGVCHEEI